jgi:hypothetical protein
VPVKKVYLIVNPYGGKGRGKIVLKAALGTLALHVKVLRSRDCNANEAAAHYHLSLVIKTVSYLQRASF